MTQVKTYPLPPLMLSEIIEKCRTDHTHECNEECAEMYGDRCYSRDYSSDMVPIIVKIEEGHGRHQHDDECQRLAAVYGRKCLRYCDDSDWVVELQYHTGGYHAVYGIKRHGDVQNVSLWMD